jgi:hypothetical protein
VTGSIRLDCVTDVWLNEVIIRNDPSRNLAVARHLNNRHCPVCSTVNNFMGKSAPFVSLNSACGYSNKRSTVCKETPVSNQEAFIKFVRMILDLSEGYEVSWYFGMLFYSIFNRTLACANASSSFDEGRPCFATSEETHLVWVNPVNKATRRCSIPHEDNTPRPILGPTHSPVDWVSEIVPPGIRRPEHETQYSGW